MRRHNQKKILITGANGFIGSFLAAFFAKKGWNVVAMVRSAPAKKIAGVEYVTFDLSSSPDEKYFSNADYLIHCAYLKNNFEINVAGTTRLLDLSRKHKLKKNVFFSSLSAHENAISLYGRQKSEIEKLFHSTEDCIIRPGVVIGNGGLFQQLSDHIKKGWPVPMVNGGKQPLQCIYIDDLAVIIEIIMEKNLHGSYSIAESIPVMYKDFFLAVAEKHGRKAKFIPVPFYLINAILLLGEKFGIPMPVSCENLLGLKGMKEEDTKQDIQKLGVKLMDYKEALKRL